ncbi:MAG: hypothetical protein EXR43_04995 [Dehalococcoidia bacterium]|nr:hypothetical protein [Dehalococcoidia bacterium]
MSVDPSILLALVTMAGLLTGTLADPLIDQLYSDPLLYSPYGRCARCNTRLLPFGAIALIGYLRWRAHCPHCRRRFPLRSVLLPLTMAAFFAVTLLAHDDARRIGLTMLFGSFALIFITTDVERRTLSGRLMYAALAAAAIAGPFWPHHGVINLYATGAGILAGFAGLRLFFGLRLGVGDVKMTALLGLTLGLPGAAIAFGIAVIAALGAIMVASADSRPQMRALPYGALLGIGMIAALLWAESLARVF